MQVVHELGGSVTCDGNSSTHVIAGKVRRTLNFSTALCSGLAFLLLLLVFRPRLYYTFILYLIQCSKILFRWSCSSYVILYMHICLDFILYYGNIDAVLSIDFKRNFFNVHKAHALFVELNAGSQTAQTFIDIFFYWIISIYVQLLKSAKCNELLI